MRKITNIEIYYHKGATTQGAGPSQRPPWDRAQARDICGNKSMPGTSEETGKPATSAGAAPSKQPPWEQAQKTSVIEDWSPETLSEPAMHNVYQKKTETIWNYEGTK